MFVFIFHLINTIKTITNYIYLLHRTPTKRYSSLPLSPSSYLSPSLSLSLSLSRSPLTLKSPLYSLLPSPFKPYTYPLLLPSFSSLNFPTNFASSSPSPFPLYPLSPLSLSPCPSPIPLQVPSVSPSLPLIPL